MVLHTSESHKTAHEPQDRGFPVSKQSKSRRSAIPGYAAVETTSDVAAIDRLPPPSANVASREEPCTRLVCTLMPPPGASCHTSTWTDLTEGPGACCGLTNLRVASYSIRTKLTSRSWFYSLHAPLPRTPTAPSRYADIRFQPERGQHILHLTKLSCTPGLLVLRFRALDSVRPMPIDPH